MNIDQKWKCDQNSRKCIEADINDRYNLFNTRKECEHVCAKKLKSTLFSGRHHGVPENIRSFLDDSDKSNLDVGLTTNKKSISINDFLPMYPLINDQKFNEKLFRKKELYDNKLERYENIPTQKGDLMKHQKIIARLISSRTPYDKLILYHTISWDLEKHALL